MKHQEYLPGALLLSYAIYSAFIPVTIAHSIILSSLAGLFAFQQFLTHRQVNTKQMQTLAEYKEEVAKQIKEQKEFYENRFERLNDEVSKIALATIKASSSSSSKPEPRKYVF